MHSSLDWTSLPQVEESIRELQQMAGDSGSSSHSTPFQPTALCLQEHGHVVQPLPRAGFSLCTRCRLGYLSGGWPGLLGTARSLSAISRQWKCAAGITPNCKQKHRKLGTSRELSVQPDLQEQSWWTCSSCPSRHNDHHRHGYAGYWQPTQKLRLVPSADRAVAFDIIFWYKKKM